MINSRRKFLRLAGGFTATAALVPLWACGDGNGEPRTEGEAIREEEDRTATGDLTAFGIQLYTLRDMMPTDPKGTLKQIADMGYTQIEGYEGNQGLFWGMEPQEWKDYLDELGLTMVSTHCNINENFAEKAEQVASIGVDYLICSYIGPQDGKAGWDAVIEKFNECGRICAEHGIRFAYHNHAYSFEEVDGIVPQAYLMDNTDDTVDYEMDIYWVVTGGADPIEWLNKYPNKWTLCHVKDRKKGATAEEHEASVDLGTGSIDFPKVLAAAEEQGMEYYILEQEDYENSTPLKSAAAGAKYLAEFTFA
ncbi:sugar phosphate isomerase/epimerase [Lewinella aquimaris]|uniref:Sugar phosphate isomerase/epimerase n=1 Tax=Neolewinella aquimaris TaxID=1835722 RepID=A0A840E7L2_9BACT|nr:sugar phosphate isomerase/epimerase [Neolewinella aquimaris]MBB4079722.1 sugar phosphate isomerase/epimerase [Neolewinella aquimaris]